MKPNIYLISTSNEYGVGFFTITGSSFFEAVRNLIQVEGAEAFGYETEAVSENFDYDELKDKYIFTNEYINTTAEFIYRRIFENDYATKNQECYAVYNITDPLNVIGMELKTERLPRHINSRISWDYRYDTTLRIYFQDEWFNIDTPDDNDEVELINYIIYDHFPRLAIEIDWRDSSEIEIHKVTGDENVDDPETLISNIKNRKEIHDRNKSAAHSILDNILENKNEMRQL